MIHEGKSIFELTNNLKALKARMVRFLPLNCLFVEVCGLRQSIIKEHNQITNCKLHNL